MRQNKLHSKREEAQLGNTGPKQDQTPAGQTPNSASSCLISKHSSDLYSLPFNFLYLDTKAKTIGPKLSSPSACWG